MRNGFIGHGLHDFFLSPLPKTCFNARGRRKGPQEVTMGDLLLSRGRPRRL